MTGYSFLQGVFIVIGRAITERQEIQAQMQEQGIKLAFANFAMDLEIAAIGIISGVILIDKRNGKRPEITPTLFITFCLTVITIFACQTWFPSPTLSDRNQLLLGVAVPDIAGAIALICSVRYAT